MKAPLVRYSEFGVRRFFASHLTRRLLARLLGLLPLDPLLGGGRRWSLASKRRQPVRPMQAREVGGRLADDTLRLYVVVPMRTDLTANLSETLSTVVRRMVNTDYPL